MEKTYKIWAVISLALVPLSGIKAIEIPKLLILDIINVSKNPDYQYLENSITPAIRENLKKHYIFKELAREDLDEISENNYQFREDYYTRSVALNLGLLAKQDVVIAGNFTVEEMGGNNPPNIVILIRIFDINKKKLVEEIIEKTPVDNKIFESIQAISGKVSKKAEAVLPNKEDWEKKGLAEKPSPKPFLTDFRFSAGVGGVFMFGGVADRIIPNQPSFNITIRGNLASIHPSLVTAIETAYFLSSPDPDANPELSGFIVESSNLLVLWHFGWQFKIKKFSIIPEIGGGVDFQFTDFSGLASSSTSLTIPLGSIGVETSYLINRQVSISILLRSMLEIESTGVTSLNFAHAGVNFHF